MRYAAQRRLKSIVWRVIRTKIFDEFRPKICHSPVFQLEGKTKRSNCNLSAIVFANKELAHYFSKISYAEEPEPKYVGKVSFNEIPPTIADIEPDVVFVGASSVFSDFLLSKDFFVLPYINFSLDISDPWDSMYSKIHRGKRRAIRRIEELGYAYEITTDREKLKLFYYEMYVPCTLSSHGKSAEVLSFAECERLFRKGGLLFAKLNGKCVSGAIYVHHGDELHVPVLGFSERCNNLTLYAGLAPLYFLILWGKRNGYKKLDYGSCKPFLKDGVLQYKKEWGMIMKPVNESDARILAVKFCNFGKGARDFLLNNPFVFVDGEDLKSLMIFSPKEDLHSICYIPGLSGHIILCTISDSPQLMQLNKSLVKVDPHQTLPLNFLLKMASEEGYEAYSIKF